MSTSLFLAGGISTVRMNCSPDCRPFEPKINRFRHRVKDYHFANFQDIPIRGFHFIVLTYTHIYPHSQPHTYIVTKRLQYLHYRTMSLVRTTIYHTVMKYEYVCVYNISQTQFVADLQLVYHTNCG